MDSKIFTSLIRAHEEVSRDYFLLSLELPPSLNPRPGQFFMVKVTEETDPLLRRPLTLHCLINKDIFQLLYKVRRKGTRLLSKRKAGEELSLLGPLGNGFKVSDSISEAILVGGGIGVASLLPLAEELRRLNKKIRLFLGGKTKNDILCEEEFKGLGVELFISTEDSSYGEKGLITELLEDYLKSSRFTVHNSRIYACGPRQMLKEVSELSWIYSIPCYVSLEERMACGVGACLGCAVKIKVPSSQFPVPSYKMVCKDGPVFRAEEIDWDGEP